MRTLLKMRLPLTLFMLLILALCGAGGVIFYSVFAAHAQGDYLRVETDHLEIEFPRNGFVSFGDQENFSGTIHVAAVYPSDIRASMIIRIFDEDAAEGYLMQERIDDGSSANLVELRRLYNWVLQRNENATLSFIENGTMELFDYNADFTIILIGGYVDNLGNYYSNCTWKFTSFIVTSFTGSRKVIQVFYFGIEKDYEATDDLFEDMIEARIKLKEQ
ncbi:MAG: hypothetical protein ACETWE_08225 [Candidatus Bathyarchaeia archaeon]